MVLSRRWKKKDSGARKPARAAPTEEISVVIWKDATYHSDRVPDLPIAVTCGRIVEMDDDSVVIAAEFFNDGMNRDYTRIPREVVLRIARVGRLRLPEFAA